VNDSRLHVASFAATFDFRDGSIFSIFAVFAGAFD
jgi:hypothetical protein